MVILKQVQVMIVSITVATSALGAQVPPTPNATSGVENQTAPQTSATASSSPSTKELQQLVAPIALYPDALVGQVLAAATYPTQVVDADRWIQQNSTLKGEQLASEVDKQPWDPSIKGLTQFPSVLHKMSQNLSWTSSLGDAYFNDPDGVMSAIQALRRDANNAGTLKSTPEQTVSAEGQTIVIQPANPEVVYVPEYSPAVIYGEAIDPYPGYSGWDVAAASALSFGAGIAVGAVAGGWGWGWGHWGADWHGGTVNFNRNAYVSRSNTFVNRNSRYSQANRGTGNFAGRNKPTQLSQPGNLSGRERQSSAASRGFGEAGRGSMGARDNAFGGVRQGGSARMDSARGMSSFRSGGGGFHGGGGFRGGGGGFRGGGGRR